MKISNDFLIQYGTPETINTKKGSKSVDFPIAFMDRARVCLTSSTTSLIFSRSNTTTTSFSISWAHIDGSTGSLTANVSSNYIAVGS